jgi:hypothetical protein
MTWRELRDVLVVLGSTILVGLVLALILGGVF